MNQSSSHLYLTVDTMHSSRGTDDKNMLYIIRTLANETKENKIERRS